MSWKHACLGVLVAAMLAPSIADAQQRRIITGRITEAVTNEAVPGATVIVKGTDDGTITEQDGSFSIPNVPVGQDITLSITSASHQTKEIVVAADQNGLRVELALAGAEEVVVIGRAPQVFRKNLANGAAVVQAEALNDVPAGNITDALVGKVSGANIQSNSGAPGGGNQISLRGISTVQGRSAPLYVIDGVIVSDVSVANGANIVTQASGGSNASNQDNPVNRIADLTPGDIENIEVLKGAAAAALYGSKASAGVIIITTKRGRSDKTRVQIKQSVGFAQASNTLGARQWNSREEVVDAFCSGEAAGCTQADLFFGRNFNHEKEITQVKPSTETSISISGGTPKTKYLISTSVRDEAGVVIGSGYEKQNLRLALDQDFGDRFRLSVSTNIIHSDTARSLTNNDNASVSHYMVFASTPGFIDLRPFEDGTFPANPFVPSQTNPLQTVELAQINEDVWRGIASVSGNLKVFSNPMHLVNVTANIGLDRFQQRNDLIFPRELLFEPGDGLPGTVVNGTTEVRSINYGINAIHQFTPTSAKWKAATTAGFFYDEFERNTNNIFAQGLTAGLELSGSGVSVQAPQFRVEERDQGFVLQEEVALLDERLTVLAAGLADRSSVNGDSDALSFYPKVSATYRVPLEGIEEITLVRPRLAYGETGNKPGFGDRFGSLVGGNSIGGIGGIGASGRAPNPEIKPERQREIEGGVDLSAFDGRLVLELTLYQKNVSDLILDRVLAPSTGFTVQADNLGSLRNRGAEILLQATPVRTANLQWLSRITFSHNSAVITQLDVPAFEDGGFGAAVGTFRIDEGDPACQIVGNLRVDPDDPLSDRVQVGNCEPDFRVSFVNDLKVGPFTLHTLLDWQQGSEAVNLTLLLYDLAANSSDFLEEGMDRTAAWAGGADITPYVEDASFLKVREVSLSYDLPKPVLEQIGFLSNAQIKASGRNLLTITPYSGLDPEVSNFGNQPIGRNIDVAPYPPSRSFWFSLEAGF